MSNSLAFTYSKLTAIREIFKVTQRSASFFPWNKKSDDLSEEDIEKALVKRDHRKIKPADGHLIKNNLNKLNSKRVLTTKKGYDPPVDVEDKIREAAVRVCGEDAGENWLDVKLDNPRTKYKLLTKLEKSLGHDIPNFKLNEMKSLREVVDFFQTPIYETTAYEDFSRVELPPNLHIQWEPVRFNPDTDTIHGGRTAWPGKDNIVTSLKYKRKYESIKHTKPKPGFYNHYWNY